eukprot:TRINITY_DN9299_c0_g1_i2.p1 TRINITY_DN9299_c0_g1~~TRINITY_DN9299_c0_g1_i2.p1  ORF type:complete len:117 (-),score=28.62 TRINITY_DN9299_c0_g1_i2:9-359(-)
MEERNKLVLYELSAINELVAQINDRLVYLNDFTAVPKTGRRQAGEARNSVMELDGDNDMDEDRKEDFKLMEKPKNSTTRQLEELEAELDSMGGELYQSQKNAIDSLDVWKQLFLVQ